MAHAAENVKKVLATLMEKITGCFNDLVVFVIKPQTGSLPFELLTEINSLKIA